MSGGVSGWKCGVTRHQNSIVCGYDLINERTKRIVKGVDITARGLIQSAIVKRVFGITVKADRNQCHYTRRESNRAITICNLRSKNKSADCYARLSDAHS